MPAALPREVAEHTMALLLSLIRKIPKADDYVRSGGYDDTYLTPLKRFKEVLEDFWDLAGLHAPYK